MSVTAVVKGLFRFDLGAERTGRGACIGGCTAGCAVGFDGDTRCARSSRREGKAPLLSENATFSKEPDEPGWFKTGSSEIRRSGHGTAPR